MPRYPLQYDSFTTTEISVSRLIAYAGWRNFDAVLLAPFLGGVAGYKTLAIALLPANTGAASQL